MASKIRIKRSTGSDQPGSLYYGELAFTLANGTQSTKGERLFVGNSSEDPIIIGGKYYADLMNNTPGTVLAGTNAGSTAANGFIPILKTTAQGNPGGAGNRTLPQVDDWTVDNININGNTVSSADANGNIILRTNGTGHVIIPDDKFFSFGDDKDSSIEYNENGDNKVHVTGAAWVFENKIEIPGGDFGAIGISSNVISSKPGTGDKIYIDPYPDGLSNEGTVIIKGDLQVDGTTTTVNSTSATVNESILHLGDVTSVRTSMAEHAVGVSTLTIDSIVGINTGDTLQCAGLPNSGLTTVTAWNASAKTVTFTGTTTAGIGTTKEITFTHAYDTNTDRGISFNYNTSSGTANNKKGFFGYLDEAPASTSDAPAGSWTYIPDATVSNSLATGTRGFLDVKGIYYQGTTSGSGDWWASGGAYFDDNGKLTSTTRPADATSTSQQVMTACTEVTLTLDGTHSFATGDQVSQPGGGGTQYAMVKTSTSSSNQVTLIGVDGTFNTTHPIFKNNVTTARTPSSVPANTYTSKPMWTTTIDGGTF